MPSLHSPPLDFWSKETRGKRTGEENPGRLGEEKGN
jgi:hypothetical protein